VIAGWPHKNKEEGEATWIRNKGTSRTETPSDVSRRSGGARERSRKEKERLAP